MFILESYKELTDERLANFITKHAELVKNRFKVLEDAYLTKYEIDSLPSKEPWKPDNRIAVNFAKYITDTMNGFFIGNPVKITVDGENEEAIESFVDELGQYNGLDDSNAELSKYMSMFGRCYDMYYLDALSNTGIINLPPTTAFMIYDESIVENPRFFIRVYTDTDGLLHGSVSDDRRIRYFTKPGPIIWEPDRERLHGFDGVPATEFKENAERIGLYEPVLSMINAYNKALSEKANDVDFFADAYLKILGAEVDSESQKQIRSNRIINFKGNGSGDLDVEFMTKPDGDNSQEHLIDRLEKLIFQISMVANISDENFGSVTGVALRYKLQAMSNMAKAKERKFAAGLSRRYRLIFSNPTNTMKADDWVKLSFHFTQNYPANIAEEIENAKNVQGMVSQDTQLKLLSFIDNVQDEIEKLKAENEEYRNQLSALDLGDDE